MRKEIRRNDKKLGKRTTVEPRQNNLSCGFSRVLLEKKQTSGTQERSGNTKVGLLRTGSIPAHVNASFYHFYPEPGSKRQHLSPTVAFRVPGMLKKVLSVCVCLIQI